MNLLISYDEGCHRYEPLNKDGGKHRKITKKGKYLKSVYADAICI